MTSARGRAVAAVAGALIALAGCGTAAKPSRTPEERARDALKLVSGIPQHGIRLGQPTAPATLTAYVSLAELNGSFVRDDLPRLVARYVIPGKLRIELRTLTRYDDPAVDPPVLRRLTRVAQAAALQDRLWDFYLAFDAVYDGAFDRAEERRALALVPGLDADAVRRDAGGGRVTRAIAAANEHARAGRVNLVPTYVLRHGAAAEVVRADCLDCLFRAVAAALAKPDATPTPEPKRKPRKHPRRKHQRRRPTPTAAPTAPPATAVPTPAVTPAPRRTPRPKPKPRPTAKPKPTRTPYPKIPAKPKPKPTRYPRIRPTPTP